MQNQYSVKGVCVGGKCYLYDNSKQKGGHSLLSECPTGSSLIDEPVNDGE